ncbi:hypothetical protein FA95DRAFT_1604342 [Auriscalpium vulgare]|uniref:Uncharacterized protein n=1 Tax=Auriscalpium vulgare TaxID=40419 RepID=A0ACB8S0Z7_9AGAM|nr:hypothetical protein FA95DRAFT_1604342 [Auriscalpium vulgare]
MSSVPCKYVLFVLVPTMFTDPGAALSAQRASSSLTATTPDDTEAAAVAQDVSPPVYTLPLASSPSLYPSTDSLPGVKFDHGARAQHRYPPLPPSPPPSTRLRSYAAGYRGPPALLQEGERPLLLIKITGFRLLNTAVIIAFGLAKAVLSYRGESAVPTTLDWVLGVLCAALLYWIGLLETVDPPVLRWLLHDDYAFVFVLATRFLLLSNLVCAGISLPIIFVVRAANSLVFFFLMVITSLAFGQSISKPSEKASWPHIVWFYTMPFVTVLVGYLTYRGVRRVTRRRRLPNAIRSLWSLLPSARRPSAETFLDSLALLIGYISSMGAIAVYFVFVVDYDHAFF